MALQQTQIAIDFHSFLCLRRDQLTLGACLWVIIYHREHHICIRFRRSVNSAWYCSFLNTDWEEKSTLHHNSSDRTCFYQPILPNLQQSSYSLQHNEIRSSCAFLHVLINQVKCCTCDTCKHESVFLTNLMVWNLHRCITYMRIPGFTFMYPWTWWFDIF